MVPLDHISHDLFILEATNYAEGSRSSVENGKVTQRRNWDLWLTGHAWIAAFF
jgi:hypothetical protein